MLNHENIIHDVLEIVAGHAEVNNVDQFLDQNVKLFMGEIEFQGIDKWKMWVNYLHQQKNIKNAKIKLDRIQSIYDSPIYEVEGKIVCEKQNGEVLENNIKLTFHFNENKIITIHSRPENYRSILGDKIVYKPVFYFHILKVLWSNRTKS